MELSLILPAFNNSILLEEELPALVAYLRGLGVSFEIVVADDGSRDPQAVQRVAERFGCRFIGNATNTGKGATIRAGMFAARGRYRLFTDTDIPFQHEAIGRFFECLEKERADVVCGDRTLTESTYFDEIRASRKLGSRFFSGLVRFLLADVGPDTQCGIKGFRSDVCLDLFGRAKIDRFAFDVELLHLAARRGYRVARLPVQLRRDDVTQVRMLRDGLQMACDVLRIACSSYASRVGDETRAIAGHEERPPTAA